MSSIQPTYFSTLPPELIPIIAIKLPNCDLLNLSLVSKVIQKVLKHYEAQLWDGIEHPIKKAYLLHRSLFSIEIQTDESHSLFFNFKDIEDLQPRIATFIKLIAKANKMASVKATFTIDGEFERSIFSPSHLPENWRAKLVYKGTASIPASYFIEMRGICLNPQKPPSSRCQESATTCENDSVCTFFADDCPYKAKNVMQLITPLIGHLSTQKDAKN